MTFGANHYVPILKVKQGEKAALARVAGTLVPRITPLLEIVERTDSKPVDKHIGTAFKGLRDAVSSYPRCFIDTREIEADGSGAAHSVFSLAKAAGIVFTPVTGVTRATDVTPALEHREHGLALRLTRAEFEAGQLPSAIPAFLSTHELSPSELDLIVDLGAVEEMIVDGIAALTNAFLADVPNHQDWRTLTVAACAFPVSMGGVQRHAHDLVERSDWLAWRDHLHVARGTLARLPTFSDYAIQHPLGVEGFDPRIMQVSATIRYTTDEHWLLVKGESTRSVPPSAQFPLLATRLVYGHLQPHFAGSAHCQGCMAIKAAADGAAGYGSAGVWRKLGTIHHMAEVMRGLQNLNWP
jgi:Beta protein